MTNHWIDLQHPDVIMIIGSNAAENHPISFKWITRAMEKGATLINVDPRFTRTSARSNIYAPLRSGTDIAFVGGMINYVLQNKLYHEEYVNNYTNASFLIDPKFNFNDGMFSGYDESKKSYNNASWQYQKDANGVPKRDMSLKNKNCVWNLLKQHFSRYDADTVCAITGTPKDVYLEVCKAYASTGKPDRAATIMYAMGTTQHTYGTQNIRSYVILQLLLGNIGRAGGGINALRGESNVQGSTDMCLLFHILPGYLKCPQEADQSIDQYCKRYYEGKNNDPKSADWWSNGRKYTVSLLKAFFGDKATAENDFGFNWLPKRGGNYSHITLFETMNNGSIKGAFFFGQNPAVGGPNAEVERTALGKLDWMVSVDLWETETSVFWKREGVNSSDIKTEVFRLPAVASMEKEGSISNSGRWVQWRYKGGDGPGDAMDDLWIVDGLHKELKALYDKDPGPYPDPIVNLFWNYDDSHGHPDVHNVAREVNGYEMATGKQLPSFGKLKSDGSTCSGNWLYCGSFTEKGNQMARRGKKDASGIGLYSEWSWCWPVNRRIIYNRASVDLDGNPWDPSKPVIKWTGPETKWAGDVPDGGWPPMSKDGTRYPFIMKNEGVARLFGMGLADGPFPEFYEAMESPVKNKLHPNVQNNPAVFIYPGGSAKFGNAKDYPYVASTYRVSEHWQAGSMTRYLPWLAELMPEVFVEMSEELAKDKGISNGDLVKVWNARGSMVAKACVTKRFKALNIDGQKVETVGIPWHWGFCGVCSGDSANVLTPHVGDVNTRIPEYKTFLVNLKKV